MAKKDWMLTESELDDDQLRVLNATIDKSCIVEGCAGSGKSVLALIKAQRIQKERGDNYQIIVFTKALCRYMNTGRKELGLHNEFRYYEEWKWKKYLKHYANGMSFMVYERDDDGNKIPYMPSADYVIVDEIQDFTATEIKEFIKAAKKNFYFFGDTAQSLYNGLKQTLPVNAIPQLLPYTAVPKSFSLYRNYRLPLPVARFVQKVGVDLDPFDEHIYQSKQNELPRVVKFDSIEEEFKSIASIIKNNSLTDVGILLPDNATVGKASSELKNLGLNIERKYEDKQNFKNNEDSLNFSTSNPKIMTYHSAKGLQFEAVFLPMVSDAISDDDKRALYVAMTRTCRYLYVMYTEYLPEPLDKISTDLYKTTLVDTIDDI